MNGVAPIIIHINGDQYTQYYHSVYKLDTESEGTTDFREPRALGCSVPRYARNAITGPEAL